MTAMLDHNLCCNSWWVTTLYPWLSRSRISDLFTMWDRISTPEFISFCWTNITWVRYWINVTFDIWDWHFLPAGLKTSFRCDFCHSDCCPPAVLKKFEHIAVVLLSKKDGWFMKERVEIKTVCRKVEDIEGVP